MFKPARSRKKFLTGFTLIELLLVIAIIGILSSIISASLSTARAKGADTKTRSQLTSLKQAAEIYYDTNAGYGIGPSSSCSAGMFADTASGISNFTNLANYPSGTVLKCNSDGMSYAVSVNLTKGAYWCVDSTGFSGELATDPGQVTTCPTQ